MRNLGALLVILVFGQLTGCVSTYQQKALMSPNSKLLQGKSVAISTPENGSYNGEDYAGSGKATALAVQSAFARHSNSIVVAPACRDLACLRSTYPSGYDYYVVPQILHWEDRATEWSGKSDRIEVKLTVCDGKDGKELASNVISGKSKWATFGGDHPQDLLPEPLTEYVSSLY